MANMVYANPFGAALEGKRAALEDTIRSGLAGQEMRGKDLDYAFQKWYQPLRRQEAQYHAQQEGYNTLGAGTRTAANIGSYTGNYDPLNNIISSAGFGVPLGNRSSFENQKAADLATGRMDPVFGYPGFYSGQHGERLALPGSTSPQDPMDMLLYNLQRQNAINEERAKLGQGGAPAVRFDNPTYQSGGSSNMGSYLPGTNTPSYLGSPSGGATPTSMPPSSGLTYPRQFNVTNPNNSQNITDPSAGLRNYMQRDQYNVGSSYNPMGVFHDEIPGVPLQGSQVDRTNQNVNVAGYDKTGVVS